jgi:radical SAM protein with 4Fe4S-binding SPASM domain
LLKGNIIDIQITGGEPMSHPHFFNILSRCKENFPTSITTTATLITRKNVSYFSSLDVIQVSLYSAKRDEHDAITLVSNSYDRTLNGIRLLTGENYPVTVSSIVTQSNYRDLESLIQLCISLGAKAIKFGTFSRYGRGRNLDKSWELTPAQDREATEQITALSMKYKGKIEIYDWAEDEVEKKLIDVNHGGFACGAGNLAWVISEFGNIKPCVFLPEQQFTTGNIFESNFDQICKSNHSENLYTGLVEWEKELNKEGCGTEKVCPVIKNYLDYFEVARD